MRRLEPLYSFDRRERDPAEMMTGQDAAHRIPMIRKLEMVPNEPSRAMLPFQLEREDSVFLILEESLIISMSLIDETLRALI
jgi:hypothetical protein